ncbi:hypothetical protein M3I54_22770 [Paraburkholderia sp. CNPSo 3274]|uniref:hypothetical protein n=1 Tax=Paraburkholderia sp. CNPSo 3274 TaxID=2940932 RepID=UPI0020B7B044|nr:hypothetical protein [Paraburkholderia sp. CNPSo 3274]MCP3709771.1 hypothetical protein [Paraburkholderia sp. CNPSo 3274]
MDTSNKYRKKPVVIEAFQLPIAPVDGTTNEEHENAVWSFVAWANQAKFKNWTSERDGALSIETLEGTMTAQPGDWIIKGVKGEFYPCKPDIFSATYERSALAPSDAAGAHEAVAYCRRDTVLNWKGQIVNAAMMFPSPAGLKDPIALYAAPVAPAAVAQTDNYAAFEWPNPSAWRDKHETSDLYARIPNPEQIDAEALYTASQVREMFARAVHTPTVAADAVAPNPHPEYTRGWQDCLEMHIAPGAAGLNVPALAPRDQSKCCDTPAYCSSVRRCTAKDTQPDERGAFEQFLRDKKFPVLPVWQNGKPHQNYALEVMWDSWQARASAPQAGDN